MPQRYTLDWLDSSTWICWQHYLMFCTPAGISFYPLSHRLHLALKLQTGFHQKLLILAFTHFSCVGFYSFPCLFSPFQRSFRCFFKLFCRLLSAPSNRHNWLKCTFGQGDAIGWNRTVNTSSTRPSAMTEQWPKHQTDPPQIFPELPISQSRPDLNPFPKCTTWVAVPAAQRAAAWCPLRFS